MAMHNVFNVIVKLGMIKGNSVISMHRYRVLWCMGISSSFTSIHTTGCRLGVYPLENLPLFC